MIKNGTRATELDPRDHSFHGTFGTTKPTDFPQEYSCDPGLTMPNQLPLDPYSCTAYTTCDLGTNQDRVIYGPKYTYMKTLLLQGLPPETNGSDIRPALRSAKVYGLLPQESVPENLRNQYEDFTASQSVWPATLDAISGQLQHRKGNYFNVYDDGGLDWMDSFKSALWLNRADKRGISVGTPWFAEWATPQIGIVTSLFTYNGNPGNYSWHNWAIVGWRVISGEVYLIGKSWQGPNYGDRGFHYIDRKTINRVMKIRGCVAFTIKDAGPEDIQTISIGILETVILFLYRILGLKRLA